MTVKDIVTKALERMKQGLDFEPNIAQCHVQDRSQRLYIKACVAYNYKLYKECLSCLVKIHNDYHALDSKLFCYALFSYATLPDEKGATEVGNLDKQFLKQLLDIISETQTLYDKEQDGLIKKSLFSLCSKGRIDNETGSFVAENLAKYCDKEVIDSFSKRMGFDLPNISNKKVVNCLYNECSSGIGDFLRGCCFLFTLCRKCGLKFGLDFSKHDISKHIRAKSKNKFEVEDIFDTEKVNKDLCTSENYIQNVKNNLENILQRSSDSKIYLFTNYSDIIDNNLRLDDIDLDDKCKNFMQANLIFSKEVDKEWKRLIHFQKASNYEIVHFRLGDKYLLNTTDEDSTEFFASLVNIINDINPKGKLFILSDSNKFKEYCRYNISNKNIGILHTRSQHCSDAPGAIDKLDIDKQKKIDNMFYVALDMKFLSCADKVYSYSVYPWGSGFSFWVSKIFGVEMENHPIEHSREGEIDWTEQ